MSPTPLSPRLRKSSFVLIDPQDGKITGTLPFQYNPASLTRSLEPQHLPGSDALRVSGSPVETIRFQLDVSAADQLEGGSQAQYGIQPLLSAFESLLYPRTEHIITSEILDSFPWLSAAPLAVPLVIWVWNPLRIVPVRMLDYRVSETAFDPALYPIAARIEITLRVLNERDFDLNERGWSFYINYLRLRDGIANLVFYHHPPDLT